MLSFFLTTLSSVRGDVEPLAAGPWEGVDGNDKPNEGGALYFCTCKKKRRSHI